MIVQNYFTRIYQVATALLFAATISCVQSEPKLPYLGNPVLINNTEVYPKIAEFQFVDQNNVAINNKTFENRIYVADFIFLSCPTICPRMTSELKSVYNIFQNNPKVGFISHTIDPEKDTIEKLRLYTESLNIKSNWHFVTGKKEAILEIAEKSYFTTAYSDEQEPGGLVHGGSLILVDKSGFIRGVYDGTNSLETKRLINDIKILLNELKA